MGSDQSKVVFITGGNGEIINIGTGKQYTNEQIVRRIERILNIKFKIGKYPRKTWDTDNWVANNKRAKNILKWKPLNSIDQGLRKTIEWYKNNN